jgi:hypothetical protein
MFRSSGRTGGRAGSRVGRAAAGVDVIRGRREVRKAADAARGKTRAQVMIRWHL